MAEPATIYIVDDSLSLRRSLSRTLRTAGYQVECLGAAGEFLARPPPVGPACLVLDVQLPDLNGLALQERLQASGSLLPIVFITGYGDVPMSVKAMKAGAVDFLPKPFGRDELLAAVGAALERHARVLQSDGLARDCGERLARLSPREGEVFRRVVAGLMNKQIAAELGISEKTVKFHRGRLTAKLGAPSVAEMTRMAVGAGIDPAGAAAGEPATHLDQGPVAAARVRP